MRALQPAMLVVCGLALLLIGVLAPTDVPSMSYWLVGLGLLAIVTAALLFRYDMCRARVKFDYYRDRAARNLDKAVRDGGKLREW